MMLPLHFWSYREDPARSQSDPAVWTVHQLDQYEEAASDFSPCVTQVTVANHEVLNSDNNELTLATMSSFHDTVGLKTTGKVCIKVHQKAEERWTNIQKASDYRGDILIKWQWIVFILIIYTFKLIENKIMVSAKVWVYCMRHFRKLRPVSCIVNSHLLQRSGDVNFKCLKCPDFYLRIYLHMYVFYHVQVQYAQILQVGHI